MKNSNETISSGAKATGSKTKNPSLVKEKDSKTSAASIQGKGTKKVDAKVAGEGKESTLFSKISAPSITTIGFVGMAVAAGVLLWKNRGTIQSLVEKATDFAKTEGDRLFNEKKSEFSANKKTTTPAYGSNLDA